ncbi:flagellar hook-length control protein FliK [Pseudomonas sp. CCC3.1]|uniref:flagellar hook-length control protein FliK n=1 Tax=Pseudomonas sp. CCC3.1 TaxID=3048607 RepID=UPI002AC93F6A|nr:flagellar hook-length control protein FliK [Pseudomonas sp. CCC3.1]MEB0206683.1 flagellar hook-length control protein FliK [Pseudomonas sp. CCC3.1]WPX38191.1 flagellar hook-length control protein FliK [Pseudomonas sp. CCC3.1]
MKSDMSIPPIPQAAPTNVRPSAVSGDVLKLLQPLDGLIGPGQSAQAQVVSLKQGDAVFQLLLKLTLDSGQQTHVQVNSNQPLPLGTLLSVTQPSPGNLAISLQHALSSSAATLSRLDPQQLPTGTLLQGKVLSTQALPQAAGQPAIYRSLVTLLNSALSGSTLSVDSPRPLRVDSLLTAHVQGSQTLNFVPLSGRQDQLAIAQQLATQQARQGSLDGLLSALQKLPPSDSMPDALRATIDKLLGGLPTPQQLSNPSTLSSALLNSGAFLEAKLLGGQLQALAPDMKATLLRLIAQILPGVPANSSFNPGVAASTQAQALPTFVRNALGVLGQVSAKPQPGGFPLPPRLLQHGEGEGEGEDSLENLLKLAAAAISRLQSHQLASLEQSGRTADGNLLTTWQLEIPLRNAHDIVPLQVKFQREEPPEQGPEDKREHRETKDQLWRVELAFDLAPLGPLHVQAQLIRGSLSGQLWAQRSFTAELIASQLGVLRERLNEAGLSVTDLDCHQGTPPHSGPAKLEQRWVDDTA